MDDKTFHARLRELNKQYFELFGEIPCISDYSCTRDEYIDAMKEAIQKRKKLSDYLKKYVSLY